MFCPNCGTQNSDTANFCKDCGGQIDAEAGQVYNQKLNQPGYVNTKQKRAYAQNRPERVSWAIKILWSGVALGVISSVYTTSTLPSVLQLVMALKLLFLFVFSSFLIYMTGIGRNWARITLLIFFGVDIPFSVPVLMGLFSLNPTFVILKFGLLILQAIALIFLFQKPSSDWFKSMRVE